MAGEINARHSKALTPDFLLRLSLTIDHPFGTIIVRDVTKVE